MIFRLKIICDISLFCLDITLPKDTILVECGKMLQRGTPKLGKEGKPMKDKHGKVIYEPYRIKVLNTINFKKSMHYNPFAYIHSEKDILKLVTTLIANTKGEGKAGDDFWVKAETEKPQETEPAQEEQKTENEQKKDSPLSMIMRLLFVIGAAGSISR